MPTTRQNAVRLRDLPDDVQRETARFLGLRSVQSWPTDLNCGQFVRLLRQIPGFKWDMVASDRPAFNAFKRSVLLSLRAFHRHIKKLETILTDFALKTPADIDTRPNPPGFDFNVDSIKFGPLSRIRHVVTIHYHKEPYYNTTQYKLDNKRHPALIRVLRRGRVEALVDTCEDIAKWKRHLKRMADVYPAFLNLVRDYKRSKNVREFRIGAQALGIAPFDYLRASDEMVKDMLDTKFLHTSLPAYRRKVAKDIRFLKNTILKPIRL